ncbi:adenylate/guanylate cyclase domain-containing protein [Nannocystis sp. SCPEA4]|uniref:adenylate/guanylate cyclase domain-containing protein n=1 Tax=Nannocystis sp. SCPEA4 TaxID=2996787 RepID=UPI00226F3EBC|nr:adenylate/guanylate cyclase domain-containing protein [Nannocystis sp. SCPEA4]
MDVTVAEQTLWDGEVDEQRRIGVMLDRIFVATAVAIGAATVFQAASQAIDPLMSLNLVVIALFMGLRVVVRRGHVRAVSVGLVITLWVLVTVAVWFDGGLKSPSIAAYLTILMLAALLLRARALWVYLALSAAAALGLVLAEGAGWLPPKQSVDSVARPFFVHLIHLLASTLFLYMAVDSLERARARARRNQERAEMLLTQLEREKQRADELLHNILPERVADQLKRKLHPIAERFEAATVLFADIAEFTRFAAERPPDVVVELLNDIFSRFDALAEERGLEKIKTIGDAYMVVAGIPTPRADHAAAMAEMALAMRDEFARFVAARELALGVRIGLHSGPAVAGVIGRRKFIYDLWGDTVNTASRMESLGAVGEIQVTEAVARELAGRFTCTPRGTIAVKGKGELAVFWLQRPAEKPAAVGS